jgi:hypothetical protein
MRSCQVFRQALWACGAATACCCKDVRRVHPCECCQELPPAGCSMGQATSSSALVMLLTCMVGCYVDIHSL